MITYQYQILRYRPDSVSGEFVNVGLVMFQPQHKFLKAKVVSTVRRLSEFFPKTSGRSLRPTLDTIAKKINEYGKDINSKLDYDQFSSLDSITKKVLPKDDSSLQFTDLREGITLDMEHAFEDLFNRIIDLHIKKDNDDEIRSDREVWQKIYKKHFDKYGITSHLEKHTVQTKNDHLDFDYAWENGHWNCYPTVSFNHKNADYIKEKVYRWDGIINELKTSKEEITLNILTYLPKLKNSELKEFIVGKLNVKNVGNTTVNLVTENEIENFIVDLKDQLDIHFQKMSNEQVEDQ